ncbi:MAG: alkaline phosphatase [Bacteroidales bacterium]|nr:alkaline phosphatase [Bacteroidales bacterium]
MRKISIITLSALMLMGLLSACGNKKEETPQEPPKAMNVIYFIGDGTALPQVYAGMLASRQELVFPKFPYIGVVDTHSASNDITDSAAGGTALCSDHKTNNAMVGMNPDTVPVKTLLEVFHEQGKETGLVVTSYITHATPACFYAKVPHRRQYEDIALQMAEADNINLAIGGGRKHFNQRKDSLNLIERMENELGWKVYDTLDNIDVTCKKYAVLANDDHMPKAAERGDFLPRAVKTALKTLDSAENGFFLMVEGSQIDFGCHANDSAWMVDEVLDFSYAIQIALDYAKEHGNTLVVVTADHETGGLTMPDLQGKYTNVSFQYSTGSHTCLPVMVYAYGPGAEQFTGWMQNTEIKGKILNACGMENIGDGLPENDGRRFKAVKANLDSKPE